MGPVMVNDNCMALVVLLLYCYWQLLDWWCYVIVIGYCEFNYWLVIVIVLLLVIDYYCLLLLVLIDPVIISIGQIGYLIELLLLLLILIGIDTDWPIIVDDYCC